MDSWIIWIVGCSIAFWIGQKIGVQLGTYRLMKALAEDPEPFISISKQFKKIENATTQEELESLQLVEIPEDAVIMEIEKIGDMVYAYDKLTGQFIAQAQNIHQVAILASERFPGKKFWHPALKQDHQIS